MIKSQGGWSQALSFYAYQVRGKSFKPGSAWRRMGLLAAAIHGNKSHGARNPRSLAGFKAGKSTCAGSDRSRG